MIKLHIYILGLSIIIKGTNMKGLVVNLHTFNFGDEALGKALVNKLMGEPQIDKLDILYLYDYGLKNDEGFIKFDKNDNLNQHHAINLKHIDKLFLRLFLLLPFSISKILIKLTSFHKEAEKIENADLVISAPGGVNIGPYKDWYYLWRIYYALKMNKKVAIYAISFGPLPSNFLFKKRSDWVLRNVDFLALRDEQSQTYAKELKINYKKTIDATFLNQYYQPTKAECIKDLTDYIVLTPNELYRWHPKYQQYNADEIDIIYIDIINYFLSINKQIVLLPHLYGYDYDIKYIERLKLRSHNHNDIHLISSSINSDIVQNIIANADFAIGSRFHTIMFSIRNETPFFALAYEHKISDTLSMINLSDLSTSFITCLENKSNKQLQKQIISAYEEKDKWKIKIISAKKFASNLAESTFNDFKDKFLI